MKNTVKEILKERLYLESLIEEVPTRIIMKVWADVSKNHSKMLLSLGNPLYMHTWISNNRHEIIDAIENYTTEE